MSTVIIGKGQFQHLGNDDATYCPNIDYRNGIDYDIAFTGGTGTLYFPESRSWFFYEQGQREEITWFDYSPNCSKLGNKPNYYYYSDFTSAHSHIVNGSNNITDSDKTNFDNAVEWLWGSLDSGGAFVFKSAQNPSDINSLQYYFNICFGLFEREPENDDYYLGQYYYKISAIGNKVSLAQTHHVGWHCNTSDPQQNVILSAFFGGTNWYWGNATGILGYDTPEVCTGSCVWQPLATVPPIDQPIDAWYWEGGTNNAQYDVYGFTLEHTKWLSGNPFSDDEFDDEPSGTGGNVSGGGYGTPATDTGNVDGESADDLNLLTAINSGLCTLYNPTQAELSAFAEFLYTGITDSIEAQLKKLLTNPLDYVLFVALAKFSPTISGRQEISFAGIGSGVSSAKISNQFIEVDCGTISYSEQFKSFLDYAPNSSVKLYLPFVSTVDLSIDDVMGSRINVNYLIDMLSGCCIARVKIMREIRSSAPYDSRVNDVIYEFQGNVYLTVPISATDWRGAYQSLVNLAGGVIGGVSTGGIGGALAIASSVASSVTSQKVSVGRSGQAGSSYGYMNNKKPYLILERPIQSVPTNWGAFEGYMSNVRQKISKLKGYTEIDAGTLWADGFDGITSDEMDMLKQITSSGFYL